MKFNKTFQIFFIVLGLQATLVSSTVAVNGLHPASTQRARIDRRSIKPNQPTPELYPDKLSMKITLMNLPGAHLSRSGWEVEFKTYFVAEQDFARTMKQLAREGKSRELRPEYFSSRILLAEGKFSKNNIRTLRERTFWREGIDFKNRIPYQQQTSFSSLLSFYSVKIYDAKLKKNIYGSDVFVVPPFDMDSNDRNNFSPTSGLYLNFYVSDDGSLYKSSRKSASETTEWKPY
ncbi:MAG TPA: hypothetical protein VEY11_02700 [Pyrinomonadaceae bacterium]|nr:hypothetical protein [Pyrinomonadaceae bacterium]